MGLIYFKNDKTGRLIRDSEKYFKDKPSKKKELLDNGFFVCDENGNPLKKKKKKKK